MRAKKKPRFLGESCELPLLFSAPMVIATVGGWKNQTRRTRGLDEINEDPDRYRFEGFRLNVGHLQALFWDSERQGCIVVDSPYGRHGDKLWVRENFKVVGIDADDESGYAKVLYMADEKEKVSEPLDGYWSERKTPAGQAMNFYKKKGVIPNIFLPRWGSRLLLVIEDLHIERLGDISEDDAKAEGAIFYGHLGWKHDEGEPFTFTTARHSFFHLWQKINGEDSFKSNPWTWVIKFKEVK